MKVLMRRLAVVPLLLLVAMSVAQGQVPPSIDPGVLQQREMDRQKRLRDEELRREQRAEEG